MPSTDFSYLNYVPNVNDSIDLITLDSQDTKPVTLFKIKKKNGTFSKPLLVLLDTGAGSTVAKASLSTFGKVSRVSKTSFSTANGRFASDKAVQLDFVLSEFSESRIICPKGIRLLPDACDLPYDLIIGRDLMHELKMDILFSENVVLWDGLRLPMHSTKTAITEMNIDLNSIYQDAGESESVKKAGDRLMKILDANYETPDIDKEVDQMDHLSDFQKVLLKALLKRHELLFDGTLGEWKGDPIDIKLKEGAIPYYRPPMKVPHIHEATFKKDLDRLVSIGVLTKKNTSEWGAPSFIVPKKDGTVRFVTDFRKLNSMIKRNPYPIPHIRDMLLKVSNFQYATSLDLVMGFYNITLSEDSKEICTITTPWGKYSYNRLPMGVCIAPDVFQEKMNNLFNELESVRCYIDDLLVITHGSYEKHLEELEKVFVLLEDAGLKCKFGKCFFCQDEIEYLGYIITRDGIKPNPKKVQAILDIQRPTTTSEVRHFVGMVQYYRDVWPGRSHILTPLTELTAGKGKNTKVNWTDVHETAFNEIKRIIASETLLAYPDFSKKFIIHSDASDFQLGAVIMQEDDGGVLRPLAFYTRKLNSAQKNYTTTEKELLSIVETLNEFRNILLGYEIDVYTDHKNLTFGTDDNSSQRRKRWESLVQEFGINIIHIPGADNTVADALSRLPKAQREDAYEQLSKDEKLQNVLPHIQQGRRVVYALSETPMDSEADRKTRDDYYHELCSLLQINDFYVTAQSTDCFVSVDSDEIVYPLAPQIVEEEQNQLLQGSSKESLALKTALAKKDPNYEYREVEKRQLLHFHGKIYVPSNLRQRVLTWYHHYLCHPGGDRLANTIQRIATWNGITAQSRTHCRKCATCQKYKKRNNKYGHVPPKDPEDLLPWDTLCVDLVGPYSLKAKVRQLDGKVIEQEIKLLAMTFIDPATGWFEWAQVIDDKSSAAISQLLDSVWLARYPRPRQVLYDNGSEFKKDFQPLLKDLAIKPKCTTIKNPQANSILERIHQVTGNMLTSSDLMNQEFDIRDLWTPTLTSIAYAIRCSHHSTLNATPGQLVFGRDMLLDISYTHDYQATWQRKQRQIINDNIRENSKRIKHDYKVGDRAYIIKDGNYRKLTGPHEGPFNIIQVHANGTVTIQKGITQERLNICRLTPHFE